MTSAEIRAALHRLEAILEVAQGNTRELEAAVAAHRAELARREESS